MKASASRVIPSGPRPPLKTLRPRRFQRLRCRCAPLPTSPGNTTGANEAARPWFRATARIVCRTTRFVSATAIPVPCGTDSSSCPVEYSGWNCITPVPCSSSARINAVANGSTSTSAIAP